MSQLPDPALIPPHDAELERAVLASVFEAPEAFDELQTSLAGPEAFHTALCRTIYGVLCRLNAAGKPLDLASVAREIDGQAGDLGGWGALGDLTTYAVRPATVPFHAQQLRKLHLARQMAHFAETLTADVRGKFDPDELRAWAERELFGMGEASLASRPKTCGEVMGKVLDRLEAYSKQQKVGLETKFVDLDGVLGGLREQELIILAGRPGMGKSKLAGNIALSLAKRGHPVVLFNLEMSNEEMGERFACAEARVDHFALRNGKVDDAARERVTKAAVAIQHYPLFWFDRPSLRPSELLSHLRRLKRRESIELTVVDHLLLLGNDQKHHSQNDRVGEISRMLKLAAKDVKIPVLALCQMNRGIESRHDDEPRLSDLRDSGNIEQDADTVLFLHKKRNAQVSDNTVDLVVAKQRNGPTTRLHLYDDAKSFRFTNYAGE